MTNQMDGWAKAAHIIDQAIQDANNVINQANGADPDVVVAWACASFVLRPGMGNDEPSQAPWVTTGLLHEALAKRTAQHVTLTCDCDDE